MLVSELFADAISSLAFEPFRFGMFALLDFSAADLVSIAGGAGADETDERRGWESEVECDGFPSFGESGFVMEAEESAEPLLLLPNILILAKRPPELERRFPASFLYSGGL
jgi:hypothetical protein